jgi:hypothetical protein
VLRHAFGLAPAWAAALLVYHRALATFFTPDDIVSLARAAGLEPTPFTFRPLSAVLAFRIEHALFRLDPLGYHVVNLALHLINVAGVYALALRVSRSGGLSRAAALLFAVSGIAFTPLFWLSGIGDLLACTALLAATLLHIEGRARGGAWPWAAAAAAFAAVLAKEVAVAWPLAIAIVEQRGALPSPSTAGRSRRQRLAPVGIAGIASLLWLWLSRGTPSTAPGDPYAISIEPGHLAGNLLTYLGWSASLADPIRDRVAAVDRSAWPAGFMVATAVAVGLRFGSRAARPPFEIGLAWLFAFLLPVLPLAHHTYLYYLYVPWAGGAVAAAAFGAWTLSAFRGQLAARLALAGFVAVEARNAYVREHATRDALPVDRTVREAMLLGNALPALWAAALPPGTRVGFVNPAPRPSFDLVRGAPAREGDRALRVSYYPLEAAMMGGKVLRVFAPGLAYAGFARVIPPGWEDVECFLFEQRGYLRRWGKGPEALRHQGEYLASAGRGAGGDSGFVAPR